MKSALLIVALAAVAMLAIPLAAEDQPKALELQQHRAEIREALLKETPLGTNSKQVLAVILKRLGGDAEKLPKLENHPAVGPEAEKVKQRGTKSIRLLLGQYYDHPELVFLSAPMLSQREVTAQWAFDEHDRLIDIFIDKLSNVY